MSLQNWKKIICHWTKKFMYIYAIRNWEMRQDCVGTIFEKNNFLFLLDFYNIHYFSLSSGRITFPTHLSGSVFDLVQTSTTSGTPWNWLSRFPRMQAKSNWQNGSENFTSWFFMFSWTGGPEKIGFDEPKNGYEYLTYVLHWWIWFSFNERSSIERLK